jgi:hypothetical protein
LIVGRKIREEILNIIDAKYLDHQREWSEKTFGPGDRTYGVIDHIKKELEEILADPKGTEWKDVVILALDGFWRAGYNSQTIIDEIVEKQKTNEQRTWPDWRNFTEGQAIEHVRVEHPIKYPDCVEFGCKIHPYIL